VVFLLSATAGEVFKYIGFIIVAILALMLMIIIHESGHYLAGKMLKFRIDEFSIGFGPAIFKKRNKKNGEVFSIRPIPIGGFCAFHGEDQEGEDAVNPYVNKDVASNGEKGILSYIIDDTDPVATNQSTANAQIADGKEGVLSYLNAQKKGPYFNDQPAWKRLIVLFSGAFFNFLSSILFITILFTAYGQILPVVVDAHEFISQEQVFEAGDVILSVNGKQVNVMMPEDVSAAFQKAGDSATFTIIRDGEIIEIDAVRAEYIYTSTQKDELGNETTTTENKVGYGVSLGTTWQKLDFFHAFSRAFGYAFFIVFKILASLGALITGKIGLESAGGTITVVKTIADMSAQGFHAFMYTISIISANLAVMNLLPIPALDGSRMVFTFIEMIFRKPVPRKVEGIIHTVGLVILMLLVVFLDVFHLVNG
jgi:regulator of sigma E protease